MTASLSGREAAREIAEYFPEAILQSDDSSILAKSEFLFQVADFLKSSHKFAFDYLANLTSVDYTDYFEVIYHLTSLKYNHSIVLKTRSYDRDNPTIPSVVSLWRGADLQEREVYDLMGVSFSGHPNLKRIFLWEGFPGHPLRRDYL